jgi:hypothetical protein
MFIDFSHYEVDVYAQNEKGTYMVKVSFPSEPGMYINGIKAVPSKNKQGEFKVYPPAYKIGNQWKHRFEFSGDSVFWQYISEIVVKAVNEKKVSDYYDGEPLTDEALDQAMKKFGLDSDPKPP